MRQRVDRREREMPLVETSCLMFDDVGFQDGGHAGVFPCHGQGGNQKWTYGDKHDLQSSDVSSSISLDDKIFNFVVYVPSP